MRNRFQFPSQRSNTFGTEALSITCAELLQHCPDSLPLDGDAFRLSRARDRWRQIKDGVWCFSGVIPDEGRSLAALVQRGLKVKLERSSPRTIQTTFWVRLDQDPIVWIGEEIQRRVKTAEDRAVQRAAELVQIQAQEEQRRQAQAAEFAALRQARADQIQRATVRAQAAGCTVDPDAEWALLGGRLAGVLNKSGAWERPSYKPFRPEMIGQDQMELMATRGLYDGM